MRAALAWATDGGDAEIGLRLSGLLWRYWWQRGYYREGRRWYETALAQGIGQPDVVRAGALYGLANMVLGNGETEPAINIYKQCLQIFRRDGNTIETIATLNDLGIAYTGLQNSREARAYFDQALELSRSIGDKRRTGVTLINLAELAMQENDLDGAAALQDDALPALFAAGDEQSAGNLLANRGLLDLRRGDFENAADKLGQALKLSHATDDRYTLAHSLVSAAAVVAGMGDPETAALILGRAARLREDMDLALGNVESHLRDQTMDELRLSLGAEACDAELASGAALEHDTAIALTVEALARVAAR